MKYLKVLFFVFLTSNIYAQKLSITYIATKNASDQILSQSSEYDLYINGTKSVYYNNNDVQKSYKDQLFILDTKKIGEFTTVNISDDNIAYLVQDVFYKDYKANTITYNELIGVKKVTIEENINLIDWKIESESKKEILGYNCVRATGDFRGRKYEAYFTPELFQRGGPWKFDGLPGIVLSVSSLDGYYKIEPLKIVKNGSENSEILNVYKKNKIISWDTYKIDFKKWMLKQLKRLKSRSEDGESGAIEITDKIEDLGIGKLSF